MKKTLIEGQPFLNKSNMKYEYMKRIEKQMEIRKRGALKCCSSNQINGYFSEKRVPPEHSWASMLALLTRGGHAGKSQ